MDTSLRQTSTPVTSPVDRPRARFDPTRLFIDRDRLPWFWFLVAVLISVGAAWDRHSIISRLKARERVVIVDPSKTYYVSPLLDFAEAKDLHVEQAELATLAFLQRQPRDFDQPGLLKQLFLEKAHAKALDQRSREAAEFKAKNLHQKPEIASVQILATRDDAVLAHVTGQLIRSGVFEGKTFNEGLEFTLKLSLIRNPNMADNGRFPTAVSEFSYETIR